MPPPQKPAGESEHDDGERIDGGASVVDTDRRLKWLEARLASAFKAPPQTTISGTASRTPALDTRKVFELDEVRRDVTAFLDSDTCSTLFAFLKRVPSGASVISITASPTPADLGGAATAPPTSPIEGSLLQPLPHGGANAETTTAAVPNGGNFQQGMLSGGSPTARPIGKVLVIRKNNGVKTVSIGNIAKELSTIETNASLLRVSQTLMKDVFRPVLASQIASIQKPPTTLTTTLDRVAPPQASNTNSPTTNQSSNSSPTSNMGGVRHGLGQECAITAPARKHLLSELTTLADSAAVAGGSQEGLSTLPLPQQQYREKSVQIGSHTQQNAREVERLAVIWIDQLTSTINRAVPVAIAHLNDHRRRPHPRSELIRSVLCEARETAGSSGPTVNGTQVYNVHQPTHTNGRIELLQDLHIHNNDSFDVGLAIVDPLDEVCHWEDHQLEVEQILVETESPLFQRSMEVLQSSDSSYFAAVQSLVRKVKKHAKMVKRVNRLLKPLIPYLLALHPGRSATCSHPTDAATSRMVLSKSTSNNNSKKLLLANMKSFVSSLEAKLSSSTATAAGSRGEEDKSVASAQRQLTWIRNAPPMSATVDVAALASSNIVSEVFNLLFLLWRHSEDAYPSSTRLAGIMLGIFENLIFSCDQYMDLEAIFLEEDTTEIKHRAALVFEVMRRAKRGLMTFKSRAENGGATSSVLRKGANQPQAEKAWTIANSQLLVRVDQYLERLNDLLSIVRSREVFGWLRHTELTGTEGHRLYAETLDTIAAFDKQLRFTYVTRCGALGLVADPSPLFDEITSKFLLKRLADVEISIAVRVASYANVGTMDASHVRSIHTMLPQILLQPACAPQREAALVTLCRRWYEDVQLVGALMRTTAEVATAASLKGAAGEGGSDEGPAQAGAMLTVGSPPAAAKRRVVLPGALYSTSPAQSVILLLSILRRLTDLQRQIRLLFEEAAAPTLAAHEANDSTPSSHQGSGDEDALFGKSLEKMWLCVRQFPCCESLFTEAFSLFTSVLGSVLSALGEALLEWKHSLNDALGYLKSPLLHLDQSSQQLELIVHPDIASAAREAGILCTILNPKELKALEVCQPHRLAAVAGANASSFIPSSRPLGAELNLIFPEEATQLLTAKSSLWGRQVSLQASVDQYNQIRKSIRPHERALLQNELYHLECVFAPGCDSLAWDSGDEIDGFNERCAEAARAMSETLSLLRSHVRELQSLLQELVHADDHFLPLQHARIGDRTFLPHTLKERFEAQLEKHRAIVQRGQEYLSTISQRALKTINEVRESSSSRAIEAARVGRSSISSGSISSSGPVDPTSALWKQYMDYIDVVVLDGSRALVHTTYSNLRKQLDSTWIKKHDGMPLLEARLEVSRDTHSGIALVPSLQGEIIPLVLRLKNDPVAMIRGLPLDPGRRDALSAALENDADLRRFERYIGHCMEDCKLGVEHFVGSLSPFRQIWAPTMISDVVSELNAGSFPVFNIPLETIKERIRYFQVLGHKVGDIGNSKTILGWLKLDCRGAKETLRKNAHECLNMYVQHIHTSIRKGLDYVTEFSSAAREKFDSDLTTIDTEDGGVVRSLVALIRSVRREDAAIIAMFQPMLHGLRMLSSMGAVDKEEEERLNDEIERREPDWVATVNKSIAVREQLSGVYDREVASLKSRVKAFESNVIATKRAELFASPLCTSIVHLENPYAQLDCAMKDWREIHATAKDLLDEQSLYEIDVSSFEELTTTMSDLQKAKALWDVSTLSTFHIEEWMDMPFKEVDTAALVDETRKIARHFANTSGSIRETKSFIHAEKRITRVLQSAPLIQDLRSGSLRERHWSQLLALCIHEGAAATSGSAGSTDGLQYSRGPSKEINPMNASTTLGDLLSLNLHRHAEAISKLVERAEKEVVVEGTLDRIDCFWRSAVLPSHTCPHDIMAAPHSANMAAHIAEQFPSSAGDVGGSVSTRRSYFVLGSVDELRDSLEEHLNQLQGLMASRWSDHFKPVIQALLRQLSVVDVCVSSWVDSQKLWSNLFPIFTFGLDMRAALPNDARAFDRANERFLGLCVLALSKGQYTAVEACTTLTVPAVPQDVSLVFLSQTGAEESSASDTKTGAPAHTSAESSEQSKVASVVDEDHAVEAELQLILDVLTRCEASLASYLETKRQRFPRLFFVSNADLMAMLSKAQHPPQVCEFINKVILSVERCVFAPLVGEVVLEDQLMDLRRNHLPESSPQMAEAREALEQMQLCRNVITSVISVEGEELGLPIPYECQGTVEVWLNGLIDAIRHAVRVATLLANAAYSETPREKWMTQHIAQAAVIVSRIHWTAESTVAIEAVEDGNLSALGDHANHLKNQLTLTIEAIGGKLSACERKTIITLITVDVHARDIILELMQKRVDSTGAFSWLKQLRFYLTNGSAGQLVSLASRIGQFTGALGLSPTYNAFAASVSDGIQNVPADLSDAIEELKTIDLVSGQICDTVFSHGFEYVGNCGCLVVTPLTDRCYITLTQALKLHKGGAPAGPAGTGKTETVKDIAHALGFPVYVFNCSDQMDYMSVGAIFKGLAMSGSWGCFDEFNRIAVEVLSVVAAQVKAVLDSCRRKSPTFSLLGQELPLKQSVGLFITMNPGYKGRTELPENVKASFRPCAMVAPDIGHICEIMLSAEGFTQSKDLAKKFVKLYQLNAQLLSPQEHYDWGLRAIRAVLFIAGSLKRSQPADVDERSILLSALRDANMAKLAKGDVSMFNRLLAALFPNIKDSLTPNLSVETSIKNAAADLNYSLGDGDVILTKTLQFFDLVNVRHSIFVLGPSGSGKSSLLRVAKRSIEIRERLNGNKGIVTMECFDPKAITPHELYGWIMPQTREWHDGILSRTFRDFATSSRFHKRQQPESSTANPLDDDDGTSSTITRSTSQGGRGDSFKRDSSQLFREPSKTSINTAYTDVSLPAVPSLAQQWIVLDGAIDADWIESMNSVMDDNKLLTLANNERIVMSPSMRLIFEITHLQNATLATVSRAGILYLGEGELGWAPLKDRWLATKVPETLRTQLDILCDRFIPAFLDYVISLPKSIVPMTPYAYVRSLCDLLESLLIHPTSPFAKITEDVSSKVFLFCCIWTFGSCISYALGVVDYRAQFSAFVRREFGEDLEGVPTSFKASSSSAFEAAKQQQSSVGEVRSPIAVDMGVGPGSMIFDWCLVPSDDLSNVVWRPWLDAPSVYRSISQGAASFSSPEVQSYFANQRLSRRENDEYGGVDDVGEGRSEFFGDSLRNPGSIFAFDPYCPLTDVTLPTMDTERHSYLLNALCRAGKHALLVGNGGTGKSALIRYLARRSRQASVLSEILSSQYGLNDPAEIERVVSMEQHVGRVQYLPSDSFQMHTIHFNGLTTSAQFQVDMEEKLEKRVGRQFGPATRKKLIVVVENLNLPMPDKYGSQSALALLRQHIDRGFWYDRSKLTPKEIVDQQYIVTMNPSVGSGLSVPDRLLQRLFAIGVGSASSDNDGAISLFKAMTDMGLTMNGVRDEIKSIVLDAFIPMVVRDVWPQVVKRFLPTAASFHYSFSLRDVARMCQGLIALDDKTPRHLVPTVALYQLQCTFGDRMSSQEDRDALISMATPVVTAAFSSLGVFGGADRDANVPVADMSGQAVPFVPFEMLAEDADGVIAPTPVIGTPVSSCAHALALLKQRLVVLDESVSSTSSSSAAAHHKLVFFDEAVRNITRISRILCYPGGNAVLVGMSGCGKRSLARLAAHLCLFEVMTIRGAAATSVSEFNNVMSRTVMRCTTKGARVCLLVSETDCLSEAMLSVLDTYLSQSHMDSTLSVETRDELKVKMTNEIRVTGSVSGGDGGSIVDADMARERYIAKLRNNLRVVFALNPSVATLGATMRMFPSLQTHAQLIFFHSWPQDALLCVADGAITEKQRMFKATTQFTPINDGSAITQSLPPKTHPAPSAVFFNVPNIVVKPRQRNKNYPIGTDPEVAEAIERQLDEEYAATSPEALMQRAVCLYLAQCHLIATDFCKKLQSNLKKRAFVTPKTFLTFVEFSCMLLSKRRFELQTREQRLEGGLAQLKRCGEQIVTLRGELNEFRIAVEEKARFTNELLEKVSVDRAVVEEQKILAKHEEDKTNRIVGEVDALVAECRKDLEDAEPIVVAARAALNTLDKNNLTELKSMGSPPKDVQSVTGCVLAILASAERGVPGDRTWAASRRMMQDVTQWMKRMENMDYNNIPQANIDAIFKTVHEDYFNPDAIKSKSVAASSLCRWVVNVVKFHQVRVMVRPKELRLEEANRRLHISKTQLAKVERRVGALQSKLDALEAQYQTALDERTELEAQLDSTQHKMLRAQRLLVSLGGERGRWTASLRALDESKRVLDGDSLIGAAFVTYCGPFPTELREELVTEFRQALKNNPICAIPFTEKVRRGQAIGVSTSGGEEVEGAGAAVQSTVTMLDDIPHHVSDGEEEHSEEKSKPEEFPSKEADASTYASRRQSRQKSMVRRTIEGEEAQHRQQEEALQEEPLNPVFTLFTEIDLARWTSEGLPITRHMEQNAAIALSSNLWPLVLDPQYQALRWLQGKAAVLAQADYEVRCRRQCHHDVPTAPPPDPSQFLVTLRQGEPSFLEKLLAAAERGALTLIDGITPDSGIDPSLQPLLDKEYLNNRIDDMDDGLLVLGDREVRVRKGFALFLRCGSSNPNFQPDVFARTSVVDFCVTEKGLQELLLSVTVRLDKPELEESRNKLANDMNRMTISLLESETTLLEQLSTAEGDILQNEPLVLTLESAKLQSVEMSKALVIAQETNTMLKAALELYQPIASRGALIYVCLSELCKVDSMYYYAIDAFIAQFERSIVECQKDATTAIGGQQRTSQMELAITKGLYAYVNRSLFAKHKLVFAAALTLLISSRSGSIHSEYLSFLIRCPRKLVGPPPQAVLEWLPEGQWASLNALAEISTSSTQPDVGPALPFRQLLDECVDTLRWRVWAELAAPESERLPGDWRQLKLFDKLLVVRCLRPDRIVHALRMFIVEVMGRYMFDDFTIPLEEVLAETPVVSPILFVLSSGSDPTNDIDSALTRVNEQRIHSMERASGLSLNGGSLPSLFGVSSTSANSNVNFVADNHIKVVHISMGQGQEPGAEDAIWSACEKGGWVVLYNVHLMRKWIYVLDRIVGRFSQDASLKVHPDFRLLLSSEPVDHIPSTLLQASTKLVQEPPSGLRANMSRAYAHYADEPWEQSTKPQEYHAIVFSMCYFHSVMVERVKFGAIGWNRRYPFNYEDLKACTDVLAGYLEDRPRVPWEDLRYVFGEVIYGGHITDQWDSRVCLTYLEQFINPETIDLANIATVGGGNVGGLGAEIVPGVPLPTTRSFADTLTMIQDALQEESPHLFLINPLSENRARAADAKDMFEALLDVLPQSHTSDALDDDVQLDRLSMLMGAVPEAISLVDIIDRIGDEMTPLQHVFMQECERLNRLSDRMRRMLENAEAAVKGTLTMSPEIDELLTDIHLDRVPAAWLAIWGPTRRPLASWTAIVGEANTQLSNWALDLLVPRAVNISCLFIPIAFLTALQQEAALRTNSELNFMELVVEVTKRTVGQIDLHARDGCFVYGFSMEGASWDTATNCLQEARVKEGMLMPVMVIRAAHIGKIDRSDNYACPVYSTTARATTYVTSLFLKTRVPASTWVLRGTALILDGGY